jgi:hypothetical protein
MNNWYAAERLAAGRRGDLEREARGDALARAASEHERDLEAGRSATPLPVYSRLRPLALVGRARGVVRAFLARGSLA